MKHYTRWIDERYVERVCVILIVTHEDFLGTGLDKQTTFSKLNPGLPMPSKFQMFIYNLIVIVWIINIDTLGNPAMPGN